MPKSYLHKIQKDPEYQILIRDHADKAARGILTLLVTINVGAFATVIELLEDHYWLLGIYTASTIFALLARFGLYYIYRLEVTAFQFEEDKELINKLDTNRMRIWRGTEILAWLSIGSFILGLMLLTAAYIIDYA